MLTWSSAVMAKISFCERLSSLKFVKFVCLVLTGRQILHQSIHFLFFSVRNTEIKAPYDATDWQLLDFTLSSGKLVMKCKGFSIFQYVCMNIENRVKIFFHSVLCFASKEPDRFLLKWSWAIVLQLSEGISKFFFGHFLLFHSFPVLVPEHFQRNVFFLCKAS